MKLNSRTKLRKISREDNTIKEVPSSRLASPKNRRFSLIANQSIANSRLSEFTMFSKQAKDELDELMLSMNSICNTMCFGCKTQETSQAISLNAKAQTRRLNRTIEKIKKMNNEFNRDLIADPLDSKDNINSIKKKKEIKELNDSILSISEISTANFQEEGNEKEAEDILRRFNQMNKLQKLKGEIRLMDQKKMYTVKKTFEKTNEYLKEHFFRKEKDTIKYKPYRQYNKEDIYYRKNYKTNSNNKYFLKDLNTISNTMSNQNERNDHHKRVATAKILAPYDPKLKEKIMYTPSQDRQSYFKTTTDFLSLTTGTTTTSKENLTHNITSSNKPVIINIKSKRERNKPHFSLIKHLNNTALLESDKLIREVAALFINERKKRKVTKEKISIQELREQFRLDSLRDTIDENRILWDNARKVMKNLDNQTQILLCQVVREMIYKDEILNKKYYNDSSYTKKLESINEKKEFQKVVDKMMALKKELKADKAIVPVNEKEKMIRIVLDTEDKEWENLDSLRELKIKKKLMNSIRPLLSSSRTMQAQKNWRFRDKKEL